MAKISRQNVGDLVFLESQKDLAIIIQNNCIKFVTQKGYNEISSGIPLSLLLLIKTHNCTLLTLHTSLTVVTMLKKLPLLQFILLTYKTTQHITDTVQILQLEIDSRDFE